MNALITICITLFAASYLLSAEHKPFPAVMPLKKPDYPISAAMARLYDEWNPHEDRGNELYSNFKYSRLNGFAQEENVSRRDPTKVIKVDGIYHVWYTSRRTTHSPVGLKNATDTIPATDWDLSDIWHATSSDGLTWIEDAEPAGKRPHRHEHGYS